mmetsp:Transcript_127849/g.409455  ORF Transcript_127849/g.409455 Transcript_127849/m.409455 type:complete len:853 (-) Transcript_127849:258-2816(-)
MSSSTKLNSVREACKLLPEQRSEENINDIMEFVKDVKFFTKLTNLQQRALCRTMTLEQFGPKEHIFQKGDVGDKFFIILAGCVSVQIPSAAGEGGTHVEKCTLERGMGFGELALQSDQPRSATIITTEKTDTLVTKRTDYEQYAGQLHRLFIQQRVKFLRQFPRIEDALQRCMVSTQDIAAMANCLNEMSLSGGEMVVRQGDMCDNMIFVRKGQLAMLRLVDLDCPREADGTPCPPVESANSGRKTVSKESSQHALDSSQEKWRPSQQDLSAKFAKMLWERKLKSREDGEPGKLPGQLPSLASATPGSASSRVAGASGTSGISKLPLSAVSAAAAVLAVGEATPRRSSSNSTTYKKQTQENSFRRASTERFGSQFGGTEEVVRNPRGKDHWRRMRFAFRQATILNRLGDFGEHAKRGGKRLSNIGGDDEGKRHLDNFLDVSAARRKFAEYRSKELQIQGRKKYNSGPKKKAVGRSSFEGSDNDEMFGTPLYAVKQWEVKSHEDGFDDDEKPSSKMVMSRGSRRKLLRIGTIGAIQYFGDRQVSMGEVYPVSLVSDPVAEIYMMSKTDISRRLKKNLFAALFTPDKETVPNDLQIMEMHRQAERWQAFRRSMHGEAMASRQSQALRVPRPLRDPRSKSRVDPIANLDFLGVHPECVPEMLPPPVKGLAPLTAKDEELYSQSSARFLRKFGHLRKDAELRKALAEQGQPHRHFDADHEAPDPMSFRFEQHWAKLGKFSMGLDSVHDDDDDGAPLTRGPRKNMPGGPNSLMRRLVGQVVATNAFKASEDPVRRPSVLGAVRGSLATGVFAATAMHNSSSGGGGAGGAFAAAAAAASGSPSSARDKRRIVAFQKEN